MTSIAVTNLLAVLLLRAEYDTISKDELREAIGNFVLSISIRYW